MKRVNQINSEKRLKDQEKMQHYDKSEALAAEITITRKKLEDLAKEEIGEKKKKSKANLL